MTRLLSLLIAFGFLNFARGASVAIEAGELNRTNSIVTFSADGLSKNFSAIRSESGKTIPLQYRNGKYTFVMPEMKKGSSQKLDLIEGAKNEKNVTAEKEGTRVVFKAGTRTAFKYQAEPGEFPREDIKESFKRGGYIHPVYTPAGVAVTDDFPKNHVHHHGIWFPWTKTKFEGREPDFWNMGEGKGRVEFVSLKETWSGSTHAGLTTTHQFVDLTGSSPKTALQETWEVTLYSAGATAGKPVFIFDLTSTQTCASESPLILPKYYYGGLGYRGNWDWNGKDNAFFMTSEGETNKVKANETRGKWCHMGGKVNGAFAGTAILCHPENFRFPQPMRLHPTEPFFCFAPSQLGDWEITPGKPYVSKYRFVIADGEPVMSGIEGWWQDFAAPIKAKVNR